MISSRRIVVICLVLLFSVANTQDSDTGNANEFVDEILDNLRKTPSVSSSFDPLKIPDTKADNFEAWDITVKGLSSLYRHGDCTLSYEDDEEIATVVAELGVKGIDLFTRYKAKALYFWIYGRVFGKLDSLAVRMTLKVKEGKASLEQFKVVKLGDYSITKITGVSFFFNWLLRLIINSMAQSSRDRIISVLENDAASALKDLISNAEIPLRR